MMKYFDCDLTSTEDFLDSYPPIFDFFFFFCCFFCCFCCMLRCSCSYSVQCSSWPVCLCFLLYFASNLESSQGWHFNSLRSATCGYIVLLPLCCCALAWVCCQRP